MKNILISSQAILLAFIAFPTMFYTPNSEARISRGPAWVAAIDAVNNRRISPTTGVYDPNCDDAKLWDVKLILDDDGVPDEDRVRSSAPQVGRVMAGDNFSLRAGSGFVVGKRHFVTAGHIFAMDGRLKPETEHVQVVVEGCPGESYRAVRKHIKTRDITEGQASTEDYAVLELDREVCDQGRGLVFGAKDDATILERNIFASGYYNEADFQHPPVTDTNSNGMTSGLGGSTSDAYYQFSSKGNIVKEGIVRGQKLYHYAMGQSKGGSGGPLIAYIDGKLVVVGMQIVHPTKPEDNFNLAIAAEGPFFEFVKIIVGSDLDEEI